MTTTRLKYHEARNRILAWIEAGELQPGDRLPPERELGKLLSLNPRTVRRGLEELVKAGAIIKRPRVGNFVRETNSAAACTHVAVALPHYLADVHEPHPALAHMLKGINQTLDSHDYHVATYFYRPQRLWEDVGRMLAPRRVRGLILWAQHDTQVEDLQRLQQAGVQVVLYHADEELTESDCIMVTSDTAKASCNLIHHLIDQGHRDIVIVRYTHARTNSMAAIRTACERLGTKRWGDLVVWIPNETFVDDAALNDIFSRRPLPTAVIVPDEFVAARMLRLCRQHGVRVPEDLSLAAVMDNAPHLHTVPLTATDGVAANVRAGELAAWCLARLIRGDSFERRVIEVPLTVQLKDSTAPPRQV